MKPLGIALAFASLLMASAPAALAVYTCSDSGWCELERKHNGKTILILPLEDSGRYRSFKIRIDEESAKASADCKEWMLRISGEDVYKEYAPESAENEALSVVCRKGISSGGLGGGFSEPDTKDSKGADDSTKYRSREPLIHVILDSIFH
jgi:hypothetical protein